MVASALYVLCMLSCVGADRILNHALLHDQVDGIAAASSANDGVNLTVLLGHSASSTPLPPPPQDLSVEFTALPANAKLTVEVTHVATSGRNEAPAELHATSMEATVTASGELKVPVRQTVDGAVYRVRLLSAEV